MKSIKLLVILVAVSIMHIFPNQEIQESGRVLEQVMQDQKCKSKIQLFGYDQCFYCQKVIGFLVGQQKILDAVDIELVNVREPENLAILQSIAGKTQVPYLVDCDANVAMAESDDIISYLMKKYDIEYSKPISVAQTFQASQSQNSYNPATFVSDMQKYTKPVIILISTTWCPPCKLFKPIFLQTAQEYADQCEFICVDGDANYEILQQLGITCFPSIVCFKNGQQLNPENYRSKEGLVDLIVKLSHN